MVKYLEGKKKASKLGLIGLNRCLVSPHNNVITLANGALSHNIGCLNKVLYKTNGRNCLQ